MIQKQHPAVRNDAWCPECGKAFHCGERAVNAHRRIHKKKGNQMTSKEKFPQTLNVTVENEGEGDNEYLDLNGTLDDKAETGKERLVAVYELKEFRVVKVNVTSEAA